MRIKTDNRFHKLEVTMRQVQADVDDMKEVTKNARIADLESKLVVMQTQINSLIECSHSHTKRLIALEPDNPFHGKFFEREQPKLKQLDQSVFDGLDAQWRFAVMQHNGYVILCNQKPFLSFGGSSWDWNGQNIGAGGGYDASNWQNSLIERDLAKDLLEVDLSSELTGSELCRAMLERGDKFVMCAVSDDGEEDTLLDGYYVAVSSIGVWGVFEAYDHNWLHATPINNQGEPLTASEVGL